MSALDPRFHALSNWIEEIGPKLARETSTWFRGKVPSIHFRLLEDDRFGAHACAVGGDTYKVNVYSGSARLLELFFCEAFANPFAFPDVGDPSSETARERPFRRIHSNWSDFLLTEDPYGDLVLRAPKCPKRSFAADEYISAAMCVLLLHEIVLNGHVALMDKIQRGESEALTPAEKEALEWDADCCAITRMLSHFDRWSTRNSASVDYFYGVFAEASYAMNLMKPDLEDEPSTGYSGSMARQRAFLNSLATHVLERAQRRNDKKWQEDVIATIYRSPMRIEIARAAITCSDPRPRFEEYKRFVKYEGRIDEAVRAQSWNTVRQLLQPLAYVTLAPEDEV